MAELDFILADKEQAKLIDYLLELETIFIPSLNYEKPEYLRLTDREEIEKISHSLSLNGPIFLCWDDISQYPLEFDFIIKKGKKLFYLEQRYGGPCMDIDLCTIVVDGKEKILTTGFISHYAKYWIEELDENIPVSGEIKTKYKEISKFIKKMSKRIKSKSGKRSYWVGHEALEMFQNGVFTNVVELDI